MDEQDKKEYELAVLLKNEEDLGAAVALVRRHNGEISLEPRVKKLTFAYEIKKHKEGAFAYMNFKAMPADAKELEHDLRTTAEVLRSMIIASPAPAAQPGERPMMPMGGPRRTRIIRPAGTPEAKPAAPSPLSNEALEKKIEEILQ